MNGVRKAVILCAGYGTRLRPLTERCPKVMLSVGGRPLLEQHLQWLKAHGVSEFYINLHHLPDVITNHLGDGTRWGVRVVYSFEETLLGTAGALANGATVDVLSVGSTSAFVPAGWYSCSARVKPDAAAAEVNQISQHLGRSRAAVASLLRRGLKQLREHLHEGG